MMKKMKRIYVVIIGSVLCIAAAALAFFLLYKPLTEELAKLEKDYTDKKVIADKIPDMEAQKKNSEAQLRDANIELASFSTRFRKLHFEKAAGDWDALFDLWREYREQLGPAFIKFVGATGCRLTSPVSMPTPPVSPISPPASGFLTIPESGAMSVSVVGTLGHIKDLLRKLPGFPYLNSVGPVSIQGTSPRLTATFSITFYLVVDAAEKAKAAAVPLSTGETGTTGAGPTGGGSGMQGGGGTGSMPGMPSGPGGKGGPPGKGASMRASAGMNSLGERRHEMRQSGLTMP